MWLEWTIFKGFFTEKGASSRRENYRPLVHSRVIMTELIIFHTIVMTCYGVEVVLIWGGDMVCCGRVFYCPQWTQEPPYLVPSLVNDGLLARNFDVFIKFVIIPSENCVISCGVDCYSHGQVVISTFTVGKMSSFWCLCSGQPSHDISQETLNFNVIRPDSKTANSFEAIL